MSTIHTINVPAGPAPDPILSPIGDWESAAGEVHTFHEPMVSLSVEIKVDVRDQDGVSFADAAAGTGTRYARHGVAR